MNILRSALAFFLCLAMGVTTAFAAVESPKITLVYIPASNFLNSYVAKDQGFFKAHGLDVTMTPINQGNTAVAGIMSNSAQISTPTPTTFLQAIDGGLDLVILAASHNYPTPNKVGVLAAKSANITQPKDLVGKKVGINGLGGMQHVLLEQWLIDHGVNPKSITFVEIGFPQMAEMLKSRQIDAVTISEPFYQRVISADIGNLVVDLQADIPAGTLGTMYVSTGDWARKNPGTVAAFRAALDDAVAFIKANPDAAKKSLQTHTKMSEELSQLVNVPNASVKVEPAQMDFWIQLMQKQKLLSGPVDSRKIVAP